MDTQRLKELIELMDRNQLEELEVVDGEQRVRLRKKPEKPREVVQVDLWCHPHDPQMSSK